MPVISSDGFIDGGIECVVQLSSTEKESEVVFDLTDWITRQYRNLLEETKKTHEAGVTESNMLRSIFIGNDEMFAMLETTLSKFRAYYNPAFMSESDRIISESSNVDTASYEVAKRALKAIREN